MARTSGASFRNEFPEIFSRNLTVRNPLPLSFQVSRLIFLRSLLDRDLRATRRISATQRFCFKIVREFPCVSSVIPAYVAARESGFLP